MPNLLIVDDDPATLLSLEAVLGGLGAELVKAKSGEEALRALLDVDFAAVLLDVQMRGLSGFETAKLIRDRDRSKGTPIIFVTAYGDDPGFSVTDAYALGAVDYLVKPLVPDILRAKATVFIDLFQRTRAAARAEAVARARLADVLATVSDMFLTFDRELRSTYVNDRMVESSGIPRERLIGRRLQEVFPGTSGSLLERELRRAIDEQMPVHFEFYHASRDRWFDNRAYPDGGGVMLVTTEITDSKKAEELRHHLAAIVESSDDAIISSTLDGTITSWNRGAERLFGYAADEVLGRHVSMLVPEDEAEDVALILGRIREGGRVEHSETRRKRKDGSILDVALTVSPIHDAAGRVIGASRITRDVTDRKRAQDELRASEGRFRLTADGAPVLIWLSGPDKLRSWFNKPWLEFTGRTMDEEYGDGWTEGVHPDDFERCLEVYTTSFDARTPFKMEYRLRRHGGEYRWLIDNGIPLHGPGGEFTGFIGSAVDIHDRRLGEERQRLLAEAGRILGSSLDFVVTLSQVSELLVPSFADWCSLDLVTDDGRVKTLSVVHKDPAKVALADEYRRCYPPHADDQGGLMSVLRTGEPILHRELGDEELVRVARDAEHLNMLRAFGLKSFLIVPMTARGRTLGALSLAVAESSRLFDVEDLRLAEELGRRAALAIDNARLFSEAQEAVVRREEALNLHRSIEERLMFLVEASSSLSESLDLASVLTSVLTLSDRLVSAHAYAVWRYEPASGRWGIAHGSGLSERYKEATIQMLAKTPRISETPVIVEDVLATPIPGEREATYEWEGIRSLLAVPLRVRGDVTGTLVFYYRSPHRFSGVEVRVAMALANLAASAIGTAELYEVLKVNDRRKDEFLAMLAHELRNPLSAISNAVKLAKRPGEERDGEWSQEIIGRQVRHLARLMDDLLDVSRITRGMITLKKELIDIAPVLKTAVESVQALIEKRGHELTVSLSPEPLWVNADATRIVQIVGNLLSNAAKYTESGGHIRLTARRAGESVIVAVSDTGAGIPPEKFPEMFKLFAQGDRTLARSEGGLGIGLTLVKSLAELHGGGVTGRSEGPGKGSEFTVTLPAAATGPEDRTSGPRSGGEERCCRVLVVDDNMDTARGMARLLKDLGHTVETAHDGPSAIEAARVHRPQYVLLDIGLPGMHGYEVAERLRREEGGRDMTIIAVSGYGQEEDRRRSKQAGIDHHFVKPVDHDALLRLIAAPV